MPWPCAPASRRDPYWNTEPLTAFANNSMMIKGVPRVIQLPWQEKPSKVSLTLLRQNSPLADQANQLRMLAAGKEQPRFEESLAESGLSSFRATGIEVLQVNVGKLCNQTCRHCHVDAGPDCREITTDPTMQECIALLRR